MKRDAIGKACGTYGKEERVLRTGVWWGNMRVRDHFEDLVLNGRIILKWIFKKNAAGVYWIALARGGKSGGLLWK
jgi:hypothetical protein